MRPTNFTIRGAEVQFLGDKSIRQTLAIQRTYTMQGNIWCLS